MSNSNEKLVAGIAALIPIARDAFKGDHMNRQLDAIISNNKVRDAGSHMASQAEKYMHDMINSNRFTRQIAAQMMPRRSPAPAIALGVAVVVGAGFVWAYLARRNARKQPADLPLKNGRAETKTSSDGFEGKAMPAN
jgi:CHASE3 domain sensor protein